MHHSQPRQASNGKRIASKGNYLVRALNLLTGGASDNCEPVV